jgi:prepilin-type N-terminal cleavage/methylation domain-containing protein
MACRETQWGTYVLERNPVAQPVRSERANGLGWGRKSQRRGFSLIELMIVAVVLAIVGAITIPRMSRGAQGASDPGVTQGLAVLRSALDLYQADHGGKYPSGANVSNALLQFTDLRGNVNPVKEGTFVFGPYLRRVPALWVGGAKGSSGIGTAANAESTGVAWIYDPATGAIAANTTIEADAKGILYNSY